MTNIFNSLFLVLVSLCMPIIVFVGFKIYNGKNANKLLIGLTLAFLVFEILRFFYSATFYEKASVPKSDLKFGFITIMCVVALFATFNKSKFFVQTVRQIFVLASLGAIVIGIFIPNAYINALDINGVCKACYMIECGLILTIATFYIYDKKLKISAWSILWTCLFVLVFMGINALTIYYWKINTSFDLMWYMSWVTVILTIPIIFGVNQLYCFYTKKHEKGLKENENTVD